MLFNEEIYRDNKDLLDLNNSEIISRHAVRGIIINDNKILMVYLEKTKEYKFPGGGVEENETIVEALIREVSEEVGCKVSKIKEKVGTITEYAIDKYDKDKIFKMVSDYYFVDIEDKQSEQKLSEYEKELMFKPCWTTIENAYNVNKALINNQCDSTPWIKRETRVLEILFENNSAHTTEKSCSINGR